MIKHTEVMKLALEALNTTESDCGSRAWEREQEAITALREALASEAIEQPAQPSKPWVGLTDEDIKEAEWLLSAIKEHEAYTFQEQLLVEGVDVFARAIEAKLWEKNNG